MIVDTAKKIIESYVNLYIPKKKERFNETNFFDTILSIIWSLVTLFAIYLSFRCSNGFNIGQLLLAMLFPPIYIVYYLATGNLCGLLKK
jgi:hypothetical protein